MRCLKVITIICTILIIVLSTLNAYALDRTVKIGIYTNPPLVYMDAEGKAKGLSIEVLEYVAEKEGWRLEYVHGTWAECMERLEQGEIDIQVAMSFSKERLRRFDFAEETIFNNWAQIYSQPGTTYETILDLDQKKIALLKKGIHSKALKELSDRFGIEPVYVEVDDYLEGLRLLHELKVDAAQINRVLAITEAGKFNVQKTPIIFNPIELRYSAKKGQNLDLLAAIDIHFKELKADKNSIYYQSISKLFGALLEVKTPEWVKWSLGSSGGLVLLFILIAIFLRYRVRQKNKEISERIKMEESLRASEKKFRDLMENLQIGIAVTTPEGEILESNEYFMNMMGYDSREEFLNIPAQLLYNDPKDRETFLEFIDKKPGENFPVRMKKKDGTVRWVDIYSVFKIVGTETQLFNAVADITDRKLIEEALSESEERFRKVFDEGPLGMALLNFKGGFIKTNPLFCEMMGHTEEELLGMTFLDITHPERIDSDKDVPQKLLNREIPYFKADKQYIKKNGAAFWGAVTVTIVRDDSGNPLYTLAMLEDISERKIAEDALNQFKSTLDATLDCVFMFTPDTLKFIYINQGAMDQVGYTHEELLDMTPIDIKPEFTEESFRKILKPMLSGKKASHTFETIHRHKNGTGIPVDIFLQYIGSPDTMGRFVAIVHNLTERKQMENEIRESLNEKEMLIKEIHHRVKNNLVIIQSLLKLQSVHIKDEESKGYFNESQNRVKAMSMIHEQLYKTENLRRINFSDYIKSLVKMLFYNYKLSASRIKLNIIVPNVEVDIDIMIPCGLIVNELISNAFKYAFPDERVGEISIELVKENDTECVLSIKDDGIGIPKDFDIYNTDSLGMQIVTSLITQINGSLELNREGGTEFRIAFQIKGYPE